jgi:hypothetical protein
MPDRSASLPVIHQRHVFGKRLKPHPIRLDDGDGDRAGFSRVEVAHGAGFAGVCAGNDAAGVAVFWGDADIEGGFRLAGF